MKILSFKSVDYEISEKNLMTGVSTDKVILRDINFEIEKGEAVAIAGESGSGKTTIAKLACGLIEPSKGSIIFNEGKQQRQSRIQILFQNNDEIINPFRKVNSILWEAFGIKEKSKENIYLKISEYFDLLKLNRDILSRKGSELSGGERIRIALIRILAVEPELLILDEPFSAQDNFSLQNFTDIFRDLKKKYSLSFLIVTHNIKAVQNLAEKLIILKAGRIVEQGKFDRLIVDPSESYTKFLIDAENFSLTEKDFDNYKT